MPRISDFPEGVALVFSKTSLFTEGRFMSQDGWHVFDKGFVKGDKDAPGFAADLTKEPFLLVVDEKLRTQLHYLLISKLHKSLACYNNLYRVRESNP